MASDSDDGDFERVNYFTEVVERGNRFGVYRESSCKALSNFKIDIRCEVKGPLAGYVCTVVLSDGTNLGYFANSRKSVLCISHFHTRVVQVIQWREIDM